MLESITKRYNDASTSEYFEFVFYCDCCGKELSTSRMHFVSSFRPKLFLTRAERKARALIWLRDHDSAYERANREALSQLNKCEVCGNFICDSCSVVSKKLDGGICCKTCAQIIEAR